MVGCEHQAECVIAVFFDIAHEIVPERICIGLALRNGIEHMVQFPGIGGIEAGVMEPWLFSLREEIELLPVLGTQGADGFGPEILRHDESHIAAETVNSPVEPEAHCILHGCAHVGIFVIELGYVGPVVFH